MAKRSFNGETKNVVERKFFLEDNLENNTKIFAVVNKWKDFPMVHIREFNNKDQPKSGVAFHPPQYINLMKLIKEGRSDTDRTVKVEFTENTITIYRLDKEKKINLGLMGLENFKLK